MGVASYWRGSRVISAQFCLERRCPGCLNCRPEHKPTPRPATWGDKARQRAEDAAAGMVRSAERFGLERPSVDALTLAVEMKVRVSESTARAAAVTALGLDEQRSAR